MSEKTLESIKHRFSADLFNDNVHVSDTEIKELITLASHAPSSYNMQHWRFIAVREPSKKQALMAAAYGQEKIGKSAVAFIVAGDLDGYKHLPEAFKPLVDKGYIPQEVVDGMAQTVINAYSTNPQHARDEAFRSASLSAMCLMLAAEAKGYITCPMSGFDPAAVSKAFDLPAHIAPVMIVVLGKGDNKPQKPRFGTDKILTIY